MVRNIKLWLKINRKRRDRDTPTYGFKYMVENKKGITPLSQSLQ